MAKELEPGTKFAAIHLCNCSCVDIPDRLFLSNELSAQNAPVMALSKMDEERIGSDYATAFKAANLVLVAARASATVGILDEESKELEQHVYCLLYALFMSGVPNFWPGVLTLGSTPIAAAAWANRISLINDLFLSADLIPEHTTINHLRQADAVVPGMLHVFTPQTEFRRLRRGINGLVQGWKARSVLDRLHAFVRALDGPMKLEQGAGERQFADRLGTFASSSCLHETALEMFRLRSFDEHLSDWPSKLGYVKEAERPRFVAHRAVQAEALAGAAYGNLLANASLLNRFCDSNLETFWNQARDLWTVRLDLDALDARFAYDANR